MRHETDHDEDEDDDEKDEDCPDMSFARNFMYLRAQKKEENHTLKTSLRRYGATTPPSRRHCAGIAARMHRHRGETAEQPRC